MAVTEYGEQLLAVQ